MPSRNNKPRPASPTSPKEPALERLSRLATDWSGSSAAFALAALSIVVWLVTGPLFGFSDTWQLVINTGTTIVTFLMVFLIQRSQNKDSQAIHLKLNELVAAVTGASNRLINVEGLTEEEIKALHDHYGRLVDLAKADSRLTQSHSVEEAALRHSLKKGGGTRGGRKKSGKG
jgi:low affinity Fe/Cu permease